MTRPTKEAFAGKGPLLYFDYTYEYGRDIGLES
jgi:hypothetical protein